MPIANFTMSLLYSGGTAHIFVRSRLDLSRLTSRSRVHKSASRLTTI